MHTGTENWANELRFRTLVEMFRHRSYYYTEAPGAASIRSAFSDSHSSILVDCSSDGGYSSIWTMWALATVLRRPIVSVYPPVGVSAASWFATLMNRTLMPRLSHPDGLHSLPLMWTQMRASGSWSPNHIVPMRPASPVVNPVFLDEHEGIKSLNRKYKSFHYYIYLLLLNKD